MSNGINRQKPDLRTTPDPQQPWMSWIAIGIIIVVAALSWSFWPHITPTYSNLPANTTTPHTATMAAPAQQ